MSEFNDFPAPLNSILSALPLLTHSFTLTLVSGAQGHDGADDDVSSCVRHLDGFDDF